MKQRVAPQQPSLLCCQIEGEMGDSKMGLHARLMSQALRKLTATISRSGCCVIFINQLREKIGVMFGNPETTTGGNALQHIYYADRIWLSRLEGRTMASFVDPEPGPDLDALKEHWPVVIRGLRDFVGHAPEGLFEQDLPFKRLNGDTQSMAHWKVLLHIVNHATLHRGQVMGMLRQLGHVPPGTDYLFYHLQI